MLDMSVGMSVNISDMWDVPDVRRKFIFESVELHAVLAFRLRRVASKEGFHTKKRFKPMRDISSREAHCWWNLWRGQGAAIDDRWLIDVQRETNDGFLAIRPVKNVIDPSLAAACSSSFHRHASSCFIDSMQHGMKTNNFYLPVDIADDVKEN